MSNKLQLLFDALVAATKTRQNAFDAWIPSQEKTRETYIAASAALSEAEKPLIDYLRKGEEQLYIRASTHEGQDILVITRPGVKNGGIRVARGLLTPKGFQKIANRPDCSELKENFLNAAERVSTGVPSAALPHTTGVTAAAPEATPTAPSKGKPSPTIPPEPHDGILPGGAPKLTFCGKASNFIGSVISRTKSNIVDAPRWQAGLRVTGAAAAAALAGLEVYNAAANSYTVNAETGEKERSWTKTIAHSAGAAAATAAGVAALAI